MEELEARFLLNASSSFNFEQQNRILHQFETAQNFFKHETEAKEFVHLKNWDSFQKTCDRLIHDQCLNRLFDQGVHFLLKEDDSYPSHLQHINCPPHLLYLKGEIPKNSSFGISIVGTRRPTIYGRQMSQLFGTELASQGMTIISGLAKGIDALALNAAVQTHGKVIAFLGTGIDRVYPSENAKLFDKISKSGCLISEYPPGAAPLKHHFPWRNRLISAWGLGVLVVEAGLPSGTLVTVKWALDQGKDCFAIPGPANSEASRGNHQMIRDGAFLVERPEEILDFYQDLVSAHHTQEITPKDEFIEEGNELGLNQQPQSIDTLMDLSGLDYTTLTRKLNQAIISGQVQKHPGESYSLIDLKN